MQRLCVSAALFAVITLLRPSSASADPARLQECANLRVLIAVDTDDQGGITWGRDGMNMKALLESALAKQGLIEHVDITIMTGLQVTPDNILGYYRRLKASKDDALLFYYSGHGAYHLNKGHFLALTHGKLYRNDLLAAMNTDHPRLRVVLTDCCANIAGGVLPGEPKVANEMGRQQQPGASHPPAKAEEPKVVRMVTRNPNMMRFLPPPRPTPPTMTFPKAKVVEPVKVSESLISIPQPRNFDRARRQEPPNVSEGDFKPGQMLPTLTTHQGKIPMKDVLDAADGEVLRHLLFRHKGLVDINGSVKGEPSLGTIAWGGSLFTNSLIVLQKSKAGDYDANRNRVVEWSEFFPSLRKSTDDAATQLPGPKVHQVPEANKLADPVSK